ncbi:MAG: response regulator [Pseudomonadales bacterium]|nr:response regulator [Pseudomonadales bacterium]
MAVIKEKFLFVDDDANILHSFKRQYRGKIDLSTATSGEEGLALIETDGPFAVVMSDMRMPNMNGAAFLTQVKTLSPDSIRIILTGQSDIQSAIDAVNNGEIFRFLNKPCPAETLGNALIAGLTQYRLLQSEKQLLEKTLTGSINVLSSLVMTMDPVIANHVTAVKQHCQYLSQVMELDDSWELDLAAMMCHLSIFSLAVELKEKIFSGAALSDDEELLLQSSFESSAKLIANLPKLEHVAKMILHINAEPNNEEETDASLSAEVLKVVVKMQFQLTAGHAIEAVFNQMYEQGDCYHRDALIKLKDHLLKLEASKAPSLEEEGKLRVRDLQVGMILDQDVMTKDGSIIVKKGGAVDEVLLFRLKEFAEKKVVQEPIGVIVNND